jgi:L-alanine-DL-glutamate epimerase-like enolase superfamily enzyme
VKITRIDCHVLLAPGYDVDATSSAQDSFIVEVHTDAGLVGVGESDVNPWIARACVEAPGTHTMGRGMRELLIGADPLDPVALWDAIYDATAMNGRRGAVIHALGAIDIALWDICGQAAGVPCYALLGGAAKERIVPYASLQPEVGGNLDAYQASLVAWAVRARELGFRAAKLETTFGGPYRHAGLDAPDERMTEVIAAVRAAVGPAMTLMVDVQYLWDDAERCLATLRDWEAFDLFFVETPLRADDLAGYARLHDAGLRTRIAAGEWLATRHEFRELLDRGLIDVAQPDVGRVGGLTEARRVCALAAERGRLIVPHAWKTGVSVAAAAHLAAATPHCAYIEFLPAELCASPLRRELTTGDELTLRDGTLELPRRPGLGVTLDRDALRRFAVA